MFWQSNVFKSCEVFAGLCLSCSVGPVIIACLFCVFFAMEALLIVPPPRPMEPGFAGPGSGAVSKTMRTKGWVSVDASCSKPWLNRSERKIERKDSGTCGEADMPSADEMRAGTEHEVSMVER